MKIKEPIKMTGKCAIQCAKAEDGKPSVNPKISIDAYNGGIMNVTGFGPVVVDIQGMRVSDVTPIVYNHDRTTVDSILGQTSKIEKGNSLKASGEIMSDSDICAKVLSLSKRGYRFQASIGATPIKGKEIGKAETAEANGQIHQGPFLLVTESELDEITIVPLGADKTTATAIAAAKQRGENMSTENLDKGAEAIRAAAIAEENRIGKIKAAAKDHDVIRASAINEGWTVEKTENAIKDAELKAAREELAKIKAEKENEQRPQPPNVHIQGSKQTDTPHVLAAAVAQSGGLSIKMQEKRFKPETLEAAHDAYRGRMGLQQMIVIAAQANGYNGSPFLRGASEIREALQAAFSTTQFASTLSNVMNMFILDAFNAIEQEWSKIASINPNVNDFREYETYADISDLTFDALAPNGKLKHGKAKDEKYTNQIDTVGKIIQIGRKDIINDSIGIINAMTGKLGRGGAIKLNKVFWTEFVKNSPAFWSTARGNLVENKGLDDAGLKAAFEAFSKQKDPNGDPLGVNPRFLVTGPDLQYDAEKFMRFRDLIATGSTDAVIPNGNIWAGRAEPVKSDYLTTAGDYYLTADPNALPVIEVGFLRGATSPTVEMVEPDADELGISARGYFDFGVRKQVHQASVKVTA